MADMMERVRKLLTMAESASKLGNTAEAESFSQKAEELIQRYAIDVAVLQAKDPNKREAVTQKRIVFARPYPKPRRYLLHYIAMNVGCKYLDTGEASGVLIGHPSDMAVAELMFASLQLQAFSSMEATCPPAETFRYTPGVDRGTWRTSFLYGFGQTVHRRLQASRRKATQEAGTGTDLVLRDRGKDVERYMADEFGNLRSGSAPKLNSSSGYSAGVAAGARANLENNASLGGRRTALGR
jgi:hypothetical protein